MHPWIKEKLQDARFYLGLVPEKAWLAVKCEFARLRKDDTGIINNCGTCLICHSIRSSLKALAFVALATVSPTLAVLLLSLYFIAAE